VTGPGAIWLASASPRRRQILAEAGYDVLVRPSDLDDATMKRGGVPVEAWVMALAFFKARRVADAIRRQQPNAAGIVLGADTLCACDGRILGQPRDAADAQRMLRLLRERAHRTITGVALIDVRCGRRMLAADSATVRVGRLGDEPIEAYVRSGDWRGKAGAYNLSERIEAGWPIDCDGDPATVMGLPMRRLPAWLDRFAQGH